MPDPAPVLAAAFERIGVEIVRPVARETAQRAVEERKLHHVGVAAVEIEMQHPLGPEDERDRGASLGIGGFVRQIMGSVKPSLVSFGPSPAVTYICAVVTSHSASQARFRPSSPSSSARSAMPEAIYIARTA